MKDGLNDICARNKDLQPHQLTIEEWDELEAIAKFLKVMCSV